jgi:hypothetical protein
MNHQHEILFTTKLPRLFREPRCYTWVGVAISAVGITAGIVNAANQPSAPNLTASSEAMANTEAELLPEVRQMQAEAELGGTALNPGYTQVSGAGANVSQLQQQLASLQAQANAGPTQGEDNRWNTQVDPNIQQKISSLQAQIKAAQTGQPVYKNSAGQVVPASQATTSFAGQSQADIQGQLESQLAGGQLATEQQYDPQFIAQDLAEEQQANPQGVTARGDLYGDIQSQLQNPPQSPVANALEKDVSGQVAAGSGLSPEEQALLDQAVSGSNPSVPGSNFTNDLTSGFAGQQRAETNAGAGTQLLASGETPEDIQYRANQQDIANLAEFYGGQTPQAQFKSLTGAQTGATPIAQGAPLPSFPGTAGNLGESAAITNYGQQQSQENPWMTGLSATLGAANVAGAAGFQPLATGNLLSGVT